MGAFLRGLRGMSRVLFAAMVLGSGVGGAQGARPAESQGFPITVAGRVTVMQVDDFDHGREHRVYLLEDEARGASVELLFENTSPEGLRSGDRVQVRGRALGHARMAVEALALDEIVGASINTASVQTTLVLVADFLDEAVTCSMSAVESIMFTDPAGGSVDAFYQETSLGAVSFVGDVAGPFTIDYRTTDPCNLSAWASASDAAAAADGIDPSLYSRKVYVLPRNNGCGYTGVGQVGGSSTRSWVFRCDQADVFAHELGHSLGMGHAATPSYEYGDTSDVMGIGGFGLRQLSAPHQEQMGWRSEQQIVTVTESGLYDLVPLELDGWEATAPQILKIPKLDTGEFYYLSLRAPIGFDANLANAYFDRLSVHLYQGDGSAKRTFLLQTLGQGESFIDAANGVTVTHESHTPSSLTVDIGLDASCVAGAPELTVSPPTQSGDSGDALGYVVTVRNTDSPSCSQATFSLGSAPPFSWGATIAPSGFTLLPGQTGSATLTLTSDSGANEGSYDVSIDVSDSAEPDHEAFDTVTYVVASSCSPGAPNVGLSPVVQTGSSGDTLSYVVTVASTDDPSCDVIAFSFNPFVPPGWEGTLSPTSLSLGPGDSATAVLHVTSPLGTVSSDYTVGVDVSDGSAPTEGRVVGTYHVAGTDTEPPTPPGALTANVTRKKVNLAWTASVDDNGVAGYSVWRDGLPIGETTGTSFSDASIVSGEVYLYWVVATDATGNVSSSSNTVSVTIQSGGGGGKGKKR